ncbi:hypothetical protein ACWT_4296 [Actinoplanes sp. SE50]|uniref:hypothetical protein n=1 Tax=unclassified Actinoplanes TaxID=2626549 RepID=UPI00023EC65C|nr:MULTISPECIES: hypothetical protein [unclassified Actinoplanes]AEV85316.1 hypothetical protein ACPL_4425 [Actinoplanes sp. SE50/110]ATO83711.1 hypothetical protein ACWT_4296 [Actinoplanes sp. SE50]SLM01119.1 uncharacterized protein ACSP50_4352 [Actinoplanes sp. SE50/110]
MRKWIFALPALALVAGGCGSAQATQPDKVTGLHDKWVSCEQARKDEAGAPSGARLNDAFKPVAAVVCQIRPVPRADGSSAPVEQRVTDISELVTALRLPDDTASRSPVCTKIFIAPPWIALLDDQNRWIHPSIPVDQCHKPRTEVLTAVGKSRPR